MTLQVCYLSMLRKFASYFDLRCHLQRCSRADPAGSSNRGCIDNMSSHSLIVCVMLRHSLKPHNGPIDQDVCSTWSRWQETMQQVVQLRTLASKTTQHVFQYRFKLSIAGGASQPRDMFLGSAATNSPGDATTAKRPAGPCTYAAITTNHNRATTLV